MVSLINIVITRRLEFKADRFAIDQGYGVSLREALILSYERNKDALTPDWIYAFFNYDHPAPIERIKAVEKFVGSTKQEHQRYLQKHSLQ